MTVEESEQGLWFILNEDKHIIRVCITRQGALAKLKRLKFMEK